MNPASNCFQILRIKDDDTLELARFSSKEMKTFLCDGCGVKRESKLYCLADVLPVSVEYLISNREGLVSSDKLSSEEKRELSIFIGVLSSNMIGDLYFQNVGCGHDLLLDLMGFN